MDPLTCASKLQLDARSAGEAQSSSSPRQRSTFSLLEPWSGALLEGQGADEVVVEMQQEVELREELRGSRCVKHAGEARQSEGDDERKIGSLSHSSDLQEKNVRKKKKVRLVKRCRSKPRAVKTDAEVTGEASQSEAETNQSEGDDKLRFSTRDAFLRRMTMRNLSATDLLEDLQKKKKTGQFSFFEHLALALLGRLSQAEYSWHAANGYKTKGDYLTCLLFAFVMSLGRLMVFVLPLACLIYGGILVVKEGPHLEDIQEIAQVAGKQPYWMMLFSGIVGAATTSAVLGPPKLRHAEDQDSPETWRQHLAHLAVPAKTSITLCFLFWTLWTWWEELLQLHQIALKQQTASSPVLRTLMLAMVQAATSTQWGRFVDQFVLLLVFHDYLNFRAAHQAGFVEKWDDYTKKVHETEESMLKRARIAQPFNSGAIDQAFARSVLDTPRLVALMKAATQENGRVWTIYMVVLLARCWTFGWVTSLVYLPLFLLFYPWVIVIILLCMIVLRLTLVQPLMKLFIYRKQHQGESHKAGSGDGSGQKDLEAGGLNEPGGHRGSLVITVRPDGSEDAITPCPREEGEKSLKTLTRVMALTGFGPGHCDRAVPHLLYTTWYSEFEPPEKLRKDYDREIQTLCATGITRDGWCYIVMYSVVGKVMMDFIVVAMSRFVAGAGYFESLSLTLTDRSLMSFLEPMRYMPFIRQVFAWVDVIW